MTAGMVAARSAVESLRSGVPSRHAVEQLGTTQERLQSRFLAALEAVRDGQATTPLVVSAQFGAGKTHLLMFLNSLAAREGFVTASLVVSPEMPLGNPQSVLKALAEAAEVRGRTGRALRSLHGDVRSDRGPIGELRRWAFEAELSDRFRALLHLYDEHPDDEARVRVLDDLEGKALAVSDLRRLLKELGQHRAYELKAEAALRQAPTRLRLYAQYCRAATRHGLVVLFDELERLVRFSRRQRLLAYQALGWWTALAAEAGAGVLPVFAVASGLFHEVADKDEPFVLAAEGELPLARRGYQLLQGKTLPIEPPDAAQREQVKYRIKAIYEQAYGLTVPALPPASAGVADTMRTDIRRWITHWDLYRDDPTYAPEVAAGELHFDTHEVSDAEVVSSESEGEAD